MLSPGRSFSTVISAMLGQHPMIYSLPETCIFAREGMMELLHDPSVGIFRHGLIRAVARIIIEDDSEINGAQRWLADRRCETTFSVFQEIRELIDAPIVIEKSVIYSSSAEHLARIERTLSREARYIHLVRGPHAYGSSLLRTLAHITERHSPAVVERFISDRESMFFGLRDEATLTYDPQAVWLNRHKQIAEFLATKEPARCYVLRSEEFLNNPEDSIGDLCSWLGISVNDGIVRQMLRPEQWAYAAITAGIRGGGDRIFFESPALRRPSCEPLELKEPLPWDKKRRYLRADVRQFAQMLGYQ
jgi:hypothetical protein